MAQTTGSMTFANAKIMINSTTTFPTGALDLSGVANTITVSGGELATIQAFTFGTTTPVLAAGKKSKIKIAIKALYSEVAGDGYSTIATWYEGSTPVYVQYIPKGSGVGAFVFTSGSGYIIPPPYPSGDSEGKEFATFSTDVEVQSITRSTSAS